MTLSIQKPKNQELIDYRGNDADWRDFRTALDGIPKGMDVPMIIGGEEVFTSEKFRDAIFAEDPVWYQKIINFIKELLGTLEAKYDANDPAQVLVVERLRDLIASNKGKSSSGKTKPTSKTDAKPPFSETTSTPKSSSLAEKMKAALDAKKADVSSPTTTAETTKAEIRQPLKKGEIGKIGKIADEFARKHYSREAAIQKEQMAYRAIFEKHGCRLA